MDLLLQLLVEMVRGIYGMIQEARVRRVLATHDVDAGSLKAEGATPEEVERHLEMMRTSFRTQFSELLQAGELALRQSDEIDKEMHGIPSGALMRTILRDNIRPALEGGLASLRVRTAGIQTLSAGRLQALAREPELQRTANAVHKASVQTEVIGAMIAVRRDREGAHRLADADAIASSMLEPIQAFASDQDLSFPAQHPVAVPADPGREAIWFGLLPEGTPILFVPADFEQDLFRFASIPHEIGHLLWRDLPGLAGEVRAIAQLPEGGGLFRLAGSRLVGSLDLLYSAWLPEIWADVVAILLLGPAALRGLAHSFASPSDPEVVVTVAADPQAGYDEHPPAHLRIYLAAHLLAAMGFARAAEEIRAQWDATHGSPERLFVPVMGAGYLGLPVATVMTRGQVLLDHLYAAQIVCLSGFRLADVPSFEMTHGLWARVTRRAGELASNHPFNDDARIVLAAAIEARARQPGLAGPITRGLRRAILGRDANEQRVADPNFTKGSAQQVSLIDEMRSAMVLHEILATRRGADPTLRSSAQRFAAHGLSRR